LFLNRQQETTMAKRNQIPKYPGDLGCLDDAQVAWIAKTHLCPGSRCFPRDVAAEILQRIGVEGESGCVVPGFDPFLIGVAVRRIISIYAPDGAPDWWWEPFMTGLTFKPEVK
jgi:hypothetical protein